MALFIVWTHDQIGVLLNPIVKNGPANPKSIPNNLIKKTTHSPSLLKSGIKRTVTLIVLVFRVIRPSYATITLSALYLNVKYIIYII